MKLQIAATSLVICGVSAFVPVMRNTPSFEQASRAVGKALAGGAAVLGIYGVPALTPLPARADGAVSPATANRAAAYYGPRVQELKGYVTKGDFDTFKAEIGIAKLYNSGAFSLNKPLKKKVEKEFSQVEAAINKRDAAGLKSAWASYSKIAGLEDPKVFKAGERGQLSSSDFTPWNRADGKRSIDLNAQPKTSSNFEGR